MTLQELILKRVIIKNLGNTMKFYKEKEGEWAFINDIITAKREIRIDIPDKPKNKPFYNKIGKSFKRSQTKRY